MCCCLESFLKFVVCGCISFFFIYISWITHFKRYNLLRTFNQSVVHSGFYGFAKNKETLTNINNSVSRISIKIIGLLNLTKKKTKNGKFMNEFNKEYKKVEFMRHWTIKWLPGRMFFCCCCKSWKQFKLEIVFMLPGSTSITNHTIVFQVNSHQ